MAMTDLYVSNTIRRPTMQDYTWCSQSIGTSEILLSNEDPRFSIGDYFIGGR